MDEPTKQEEPRRLAQLLVTLDVTTLALEFHITAPNLEIALMMARWSTDELKRRIDQEWAKQHGQRIIVAGGPLPAAPGSN